VTIWAPQLDPDGLSQGDLVDDLVFANVHPLTPARKTSVHGQSGWVAQHWNPDSDGVCHVVARAKKSMGLVLSHSCDIDKKQKKSRIFVAPVVPLATLAQAEQAKVMEQARIAAFPLAASLRGDLYADLRLAMAIDPRMVDDKNRLASMTETGREMLQARMVVLFTRRA
jgi:hypothetical protein